MKYFKPTYKMKLDDPGDYFKKVSSGTGRIKPRKGKGSFKRKEKHRKRGFNDGD